MATTWQVVKDSAGNIHLTPSGVAVPYGVQSVQLRGSGNALIISLKNALETLGADAGQVNTILTPVLNDGSPSSITARRGGGYQPTTAATVTDFGITALTAGVGGAFSALGGVADTAAGSDAAQAASEDTAGESKSSGAKSAAKSAAGAGAGAAAKGLVGAATAALTAGDWVKILIRALEMLAGLALVLLGLQALTGTGSGNPIQAAKTVAKKVR